MLLTEWNEFRILDLLTLKEMLKLPIFIDLRNVYEPERMRRMGFEYYSLGRGIAKKEQVKSGSQSKVYETEAKS